MRWLLLFISLSSAWACSCLSSPPSPPDAWRLASLVFVGRVQRVTPVGLDLLSASKQPQTAWLRVQEAFKGTTVGESVRVDHPEGCYAKFEPGQSVLLYLLPGSTPGTWAARPCGRSRNVVRAADDLLFLRALPGSAVKSRLSGTIEYDWKLPPQTLKGIPVRISTPKLTLNLYTDANGVFEIYGLPAGSYRVEPLVPKGLKAQIPAVSDVPLYGQRGKDRWVIALRPDAAVSLDFAIFAEFEPGVVR